jgi:hypothetical protein
MTSFPLSIQKWDFFSSGHFIWSFVEKDKKPNHIEGSQDSRISNPGYSCSASD